MKFFIKAAKKKEDERRDGDSVDFFSLNLCLFMFLEKMTGKEKRLKLLLDAFFQKRNQTTRLEADKLKIFLKSIFSNKSWSTKNRKRESTLASKHGKTENRKNMGKKKI